jgi:hypothetical protein
VFDSHQYRLVQIDLNRLMACAGPVSARPAIFLSQANVIMEIVVYLWVCVSGTG